MKTGKPPHQIRPITPGFGKRLALAIQKNESNQKTIARQLGVSGVLIGQIIKGKKSGKSHIPVLAGILNVAQEWLAFGENPPPWMPRDDAGRFWIEKIGPDKTERLRTPDTQNMILRLMLGYAQKRIPIELNDPRFSVEILDKAIAYFEIMAEDFKNRYVNDKTISCILTTHDSKTGKTERIDPRIRA